MQATTRILLTNDDGYGAIGITCLEEALKQQHDVVVVAPEREQSGVSHGFTFSTPIHCTRHRREGQSCAYAVNGTPSDCVKLAVSQLLPQRPDIVVSGINLGENTGVAGHYSGTVAAAREAAFWGIPGIAFSLCIEGQSHLSDYARYATRLIPALLGLYDNGMSQFSHNVFFNVNFPSCSTASVKGLRICRQSLAFYDDRYKPIAEDENRTTFQLHGTRMEVEESMDFDSRAIQEGNVTITPLSLDATAESAMGPLSVLENNHPFREGSIDE